ncbi:MAG: VWA domain-containing protein, partial [Pseudomonadota bacterium]
PERRNAVKVLMLFDIGGSMDDHIKVAEELFSAAKTEFKHLEYYYFHNCLYEGVWRDNRRRWTEQTPTWEVLNTYGPDYKLIFVGDASMSPYEIVYPGGANEHWNEESGEVWLRRALDKYPSAAWINPVPESRWQYTHSIGMVSQIMENRMFPMTLAGLDRATRELGR